MLRTYDVIIIGGGIIGSAIAYFLSANQNFDGTVLVVDRDLTYVQNSTSLSVGGIRQQFSTPENILISKFAEYFIKHIGEFLTIEDEEPNVSFVENGYLFLASEKGLPILRRNHDIQRAHEVNVRLLDSDKLGKRFPWLNVSDLAAGSIGLSGEGWIDPYSLLMAFVKKAKSQGVHYIENEVVAIKKSASTVTSVRLADDSVLSCGSIVNAAGPRAAQVAELAGICDLPVHPRKRFVYTFNCREEIENCPLVIDPGGVYFRPEGRRFICGVSPKEEDDPDCLDVRMEYNLFERIIWPKLAVRVPAFESIKLGNSWAGHYAVNTIDQNAILGPHPKLKTFYFANGFSGHGLQQAPAVGRALSELIAFGSFRSINLSSFSFERFGSGALLREINVV